MLPVWSLVIVGLAVLFYVVGGALLTIRRDRKYDPEVGTRKDSKYNAGDYFNYQAASRFLGMWWMVGFVVVFVLFAIMIVVGMVGSYI